MAFRSQLFALLTLLTFGLLTLPTKADTEYWQAVNVNIPIAQEDWGTLKLNSFTVAQLAPRFEGIGVLRFSNGPLWIPNDFFQLGAYGDIIYIEAPAGNPTQEYRFNLEPTFKGLWGKHWKWVNRSRLEYRLFPDQDSWRFRNKMRLNLIQTDLGFVPFVDNEFFVSPFDKGFDQNRSRLGLQWKLPSAGQSVEIAYQWRWRKNAKDVWDNDHILMLFYFFNPNFAEVS